MEEMTQHTLIGIDTENAFTRKLHPLLGGLAKAILRCAAIVTWFTWHLSARDSASASVRCGWQRAIPNLVRVVPEQFNISMDTWLAMHENMRSNPACAAVYTALAAGLEDYINGR